MATGATTSAFMSQIVHASCIIYDSRNAHIFLSEVDWQVDHVYWNQSVDWQRFSRLSQSTLHQVSRSYAQRLTPGTRVKCNYVNVLNQYVIRLCGLSIFITLLTNTVSRSRDTNSKPGGYHNVGLDKHWVWLKYTHGQADDIWHIISTYPHSLQHYLNLFFCFSPVHQPAGNDKVEIRFLHCNPAQARSVAVVMSELYTLMSSLTLSIYFFHGVPTSQVLPYDSARLLMVIQCHWFS